MNKFSIKLSDTVVVEAAGTKKRKVSKFYILRDALAGYLVSTPHSKKAGSFLDLANDLCGCIKASADLSTNKKKMDGFGE